MGDALDNAQLRLLLKVGGGARTCATRIATGRALPASADLAKLGLMVVLI